jgi:hypothetical protein
MLAGCAAFIDDIAEEMISATADQGAISAWSEEALDQIFGLIDDAAALEVENEGMKAPMAPPGASELSPWDHGTLDQIATLIDHAAQC